MASPPQSPARLEKKRKTDPNSRGNQQDANTDGSQALTNEDHPAEAAKNRLGKIIIFKDTSGHEQRIRLDHNEHLQNLLLRMNENYLIDSDHLGIVGFDQLVDGATYTVGTPKMPMAPPVASAPASVPFPDKGLPALDNCHIRPLIPYHEKPKKYICASDYRDHLMQKIIDGLKAEDSSSKRVPPMALVGCSRSGKTAALEEIATALSEHNADDRIHVILVTFNDYSPVAPTEQADPLQALLRRMVFAMKSDQRRNATPTEISDDFLAFCKMNYTFDPDIIWWYLGNKARIVLLIDELNNLTELATKSEAARSFGWFLRRNFLSRKNNYLVFTTHVLGAVTAFGKVVDSSAASSRGIVLQHLPVACDLADVLAFLNPKLHGPLEAIYYGLLPGLIYDQRDEWVTNLKQQDAIASFQSRSMQEQETWVVKILESMFSGNLLNVPPELHILLTVRRPEPNEQQPPDFAKISWVPFILQDVLRQADLAMGTWLRNSTMSMAKLLWDLKETRLGSGKGYEYLFAVAFLARCIARLPCGDLLPKEWTDESRLEVEWNSFDQVLATNFFNECKTWQEMEPGIKIASRNPTIAIFYPKNEFFERYDLVVVFAKEQVIIDKRAFQLKRGQASPRKSPLHEFGSSSFLVKGSVKDESYVNSKGWKVLGANEIRFFLGESGRLWTPDVFNVLNKTFSKKGPTG